MSDTVNHPAHYNAHPAGVECIELVERLPFCHGNAIKYLWRADHKGAQAEDLQKALWYVRRAQRSDAAMQVTFQGESWGVLQRALAGFAEPIAGVIAAIALDRLDGAEAQLLLLVSADT